MRTLAMAAMFAAASGFPAAAQDNPFENELFGIADLCLGDEVGPTATPTGLLAVCEKTLVDLAPLQSRSLSGHDRNLLNAVTAMTEGGIAGAYSDIDESRSARVCTHMEAAWTVMSRIDASVSPDNYKAMFSTLRETTVPVIGLCRDENGSPPNAAPLPA